MRSDVRLWAVKVDGESRCGTEPNKEQTDASRCRFIYLLSLQPSTANILAFHHYNPLPIMPKVPAVKSTARQSSQLFVFKHESKRILVQRPKSYEVSQ